MQKMCQILNVINGGMQRLDIRAEGVRPRVIFCWKITVIYGLDNLYF